MANKEKIKVAVHGAAGRVGQEVISAVDNAADIDLTCAIDKISEYQSNVQVPYYNNVHEALSNHPSDVIVDFSLAAACLEMIPQAVALQVSPVIGTTGFNESDLETIKKTCNGNYVPGFIAPNFTIGAVLLGKLAAMAAPYFEYVDLIEEHHENKIDSPSGTAIQIAKAIHDAHPNSFSQNNPQREPLEGARGASFHGINIHSSRMPGRLAHHQVTFGGPGQTLVVRHDTNDRECYMPGVLLAVRRVLTLSTFTTGLEQLLDF
jgi:4-hydroxy-tetrahydrodipicolinate reductase